MKAFKIAALAAILLSAAAVPAASGRSIVIQSCKLPSGITVLHNGACSELRETQAAAPAAPMGSAAEQPAFAVSNGLASTPGTGPAIKRDAFLALLKGSITAECERPQSPFACMVRNPEVCRKTLPAAMDQCEKSMKNQLPAELRSREEGKHWGMQLGTCVGNQYLVMAGSANLDIAKCTHLMK